MDGSKVLNIIAIVAAIVFLFYGYGYYIDRSLGEVCINSEEFLEGLSQVTFAELIAEFDTPPEKITQNYLEPKMTEIRKMEKGANPITLSELETMYLVLGGYLEENKCDLFPNIAKAAQARTIMLYSEEFRKVEALELVSEITALEKKSDLIDHISAPKTCGFGIDNPVLEEREEEYCSAVHEANYFLVKQLELQIDDNDQVSQIYKATLANCFADCLNEEISCVEECWQRKLG